MYPRPIPVPSMFDMLFAEIIITYYYYVYLQQVIKHDVLPENLLLDQFGSRTVGGPKFAVTIGLTLQIDRCVEEF